MLNYLRLATPFVRGAVNPSSLVWKNLTPCRTFLTGSNPVGRSSTLLQNVKKVTLTWWGCNLFQNLYRKISDQIPGKHQHTRSHSADVTDPVLHKAGSDREGPESGRILATWLQWNGLRGCCVRWDRLLWICALLCLHCGGRDSLSNGQINLRMI